MVGPAAATVLARAAVFCAALCALAACVYMAGLGKDGIKRIAELNLESVDYLRSEIGKLKDVEIIEKFLKD